MSAAVDVCRGILRLGDVLPPANSASVERAVEAARSIDGPLASLFATAPEVVVFHRDGTLFVNFWSMSEHVGRPAETRVIDRLRERQIGRLHIRFVPSSDEWHRIIEAFFAAPPGNFGRLAQELADRGVSSLRLEKVGSAGVFRRHSLTPERRVRYVFFEAINSAQALFAAALGGHPVPLKWIKRAAQRIVDLQIGEDAFSRDRLLALSRIKNWGGYEANHATNTAIYSTALAVQLGLPRAIVYEIGVACFLYSLSRCFIPESVATKPTALGADEWRAVRDAALLTFPVISRMQAISDIVMEVLLAIWELRDRKSLSASGEGSTSTLGFYAQVIALCSAYDALTTTRPYRARPLSHERAIETVHADYQATVDPVLLETFCAHQLRSIAGLPLLLEGDRIGVVIPAPARASAEAVGDARLTVHVVASRSGSPLDEVLELTAEELSAISHGSLCLADHPAVQVPVLDAILEG